MTTYEILVDPQRLLRVRFVDATRTEQNLVALTCAYVPVRGTTGQLQVAVEVVVDPAMQNPGVAYYCDPQRLQHHVIPPGHLRGIHPYLSQ
ncbi:MAG TPA: hypothetical protein VF516_18780 [Kofleriaceae bacterium]